MTRLATYAPAAYVPALWIAAAGLLGACTKESSEPAFPVAPALELTSQTPTPLAAYADTLRLVLAYTDGDGDLGGGGGLLVQDRRLDAPDVFAIEDLVPEGSGELALRGELTATLGPYFVLGNAASETFALELWLVDAAGRESNRVLTAPITVVR